MKNYHQISCSGQAKLEYALILVLVALVAVVSLALLGPGIRDSLRSLLGEVPAAAEELQEEEEEEVEEENNISQILAIKNDFLARMQAYYDKNRRWPRPGNDFRFTDIGLNPRDWDEPVEGIIWNPHGNRIGLANQRGDNIQIYVNDLQGNTLHLYDGWNIWCQVGAQHCYYHTVAPGNEIDINTLVVTGQ